MTNGVQVYLNDPPGVFIMGISLNFLSISLWLHAWDLFLQNISFFLIHGGTNIFAYGLKIY